MLRKRQRQVRSFSIIASILLIFSLFTPGTIGAEANDSTKESLVDSKTAASKVSNRLVDEFEESDKVTFLIKLKDKAETDKVIEAAQKKAENNSMSSKKSEFLQHSSVISELKTTAVESQQRLEDYLTQEADAADVHSYYIVNAMAVTATKDVAQKVAAFDEVEKILPNEEREIISPVESEGKAPAADDEIEWNVDRVNAPQAWDMGYDGTGTVVAAIDTGVQWDHPALKEKYRGYDSDNGDVDHSFSWYDATAGESEPYDDVGHGTHVTGTMAGGESDGSNQVGVAPGAEFIHVKAFTEAGGTDADLLDAAEWIMAPTDEDGNERVDLAPDVVNNSWGGGPGLDEWYRDVVKEWRHVGIFPEFSAGNVDLTNPGGPGSVAAPSNYPESFATGATDKDDDLAGFSLQGPSPYDQIKPDISAPGVSIRSAMPGDDYGLNDGTSMAGPAVSGVATLLRQVNSNIDVDAMEEVLTTTATSLTDDEFEDSPNNGYGHGLVDAQNAISSLEDGLGTLAGTVSEEGEDDEAPTYDHESPAETYTGMDLDLEIEASDNISVTSVELEYESGDASGTLDADLVDGDTQDGTYAVTIPGEDIDGDELTYHWTINDYGNNEVTSDTYTVTVNEGIGVGYEEDFESKPIGWTSFGEEDSWEWGEPKSGPESAASGDNVYATNLDGDYASSMNATLVMPPVDLPDSDAFLKFKQWYDFEKYGSGTAYDYGHVFVSTDMEEWEQLERYEGTSDDWEDAEVDLSDYSGERIYIGFNVESDISVTREGWYIDDVELTDESADPDSASLMRSEGNSMKSFGLNQTSIGSGLSLGVIDQDNVPFKEKVNPDEIKPEMPKKKDLIEADQSNPSDLPLGAEVTVLETDRSTKTDPNDGSYSLTHPAGDYTTMAEAYGFHSDEQDVTIEDDETTEANFVLDELAEGTVEGTITNEATGDPIDDATILLKEDANVEPVKSDDDGYYDITAYEGEYTMKVMAQDFHSTEVEVTVTEDGVEENVELEPFYTYPGEEIGYDDGVADNARAFYDADNAWAVKMSLPDDKDSAVVTDGVFKFWNNEFPDPGGTEFAVEVWDATGEDGLPGEMLAGPIEAEAIRDETDWTVVDLSEENIIVEGDFYVVYRQLHDNTQSPGLATDETSPNAERSYQGVSGSWEQSPAEEGNYMIRARVDYEVEQPEITSPEDGEITNEEEMTVEGTASPTTSIQLQNNGEAVDTVEVDDDGEFSVPMTLDEGDNELVAVTQVDGDPAGESDPVEVVLDTTSPELTIDNPKDGEKMNRETVTVEGTVADDNLDEVTVNGQEADISGSDYSKRILLDNGKNTIEVVARDAAGNETTESVTVDVKYDASEIENLTPDEDVDLSTGESVKIEFDSEPGLKPTFFIHMPLTNNQKQIANATELPMMEESEGHYVGYWTVPKGTVANGGVIEVKIVDDYANETRQEAEGKLYINQ